ncbi:NfeD family protein [Criibacterium bergeronii]|uniref:Nodulation efficiency protein NfeD n=1 Tax=Criibacterium bergeronii TaxID=1871336 RepID=A0A371IN62_9FIRM|nr:NfeD family protein [Criibacterium bergeronii]RDY21924.1 nodulation efficiency protein NfeD [Criibacterium bergeronii]TRW26849.1 nodulation efficiency protein NfeD [Criibacterium bergeronii]
MWLILFIIGLILIGIEIFIPGFGVFGISGAALMLVSSVALLNTPYGVVFLVISVFMALFIFFILFILIYKAINKVPPKFMENTLFLSKSLKSNEGFTSSKENNNHLGEIMTVDTFLRPSGKVIKDGIVYDAMSNNKFIEKGKNVEVIGNKGYILIVREV